MKPKLAALLAAVLMVGTTAFFALNSTDGPHTVPGTGRIIGQTWVTGDPPGRPNEPTQARVWVRQAVGPDTFWARGSFTVLVTNESGEFTIDVPPGTYDIEAVRGLESFPPGSFRPLFVPERVTVNAGQIVYVELFYHLR